MKIDTGCLRRALCVAASAALAGCAASEARVPYPAFIQVDELPGIYIAGLPGVQATRLAGNPSTRRSSNHVILPRDWSFTTGAAPGKSVEIFVLAGRVTVGEFALGAGGYAFIPAGSTGMPMASADGAAMLYFLDDANEESVIQTPLILDTGLFGWQPLSEDPNDLGLSVKVMREDPGSGARTWLLQVDPVVTPVWQQSTATREGYLVSGTYRDTECLNGEPESGDYAPGGYFHRVPGALHGGPEAGTDGGAVWFMRILEQEIVVTRPGCGIPDAVR